MSPSEIQTNPHQSAHAAVKGEFQHETLPSLQTHSRRSEATISGKAVSRWKSCLLVSIAAISHWFPQLSSLGILQCQLMGGKKMLDKWREKHKMWDKSQRKNWGIMNCQLGTAKRQNPVPYKQTLPWEVPSLQPSETKLEIMGRRNASGKGWYDLCAFYGWKPFLLSS